MRRKLSQGVLHALNEMQSNIKDIFLVTRLVGFEPFPIVVCAKFRQELDRLFLESSVTAAHFQQVSGAINLHGL